MARPPAVTLFETIEVQVGQIACPCSFGHRTHGEPQACWVNARRPQILLPLSTNSHITVGNATP